MDVMCLLGDDYVFYRLLSIRSIWDVLNSQLNWKSAYRLTASGTMVF